MPMPSAAVDRIFMRLELAYGHRFLSQWPGVDAEVIKADWARKLEGWENRPDAIRYAVAHLPADEPVNALQFRELCRRAPERRDTALLNAPAPNPEAVAKAMAEVAGIAQPSGDLLSRHRENMVREIAGERLPMARRDFWRVALRSEILRLYGMDTASKRLDLQELGRRIAERANANGVPA